MRKILVFVLAALMLVACTACGGEEKPSATTGTPSSSQSGDSSTTQPPETSAGDVTKSITLNDVMNHAESPASDFFCDDNGKGGLVLVEYLGKDEIVVLPETINGKKIVEIRQLVFANSELKGIRLSSSVETVGKGAFGNNPNLEIVVCGAGLRTIGEAAFQRCNALREVVLNDGLNSIGKLAFSYSTALKTVEIPESVTDIQNSFYGMPKDFKLIGKAGSVAETYATGASIQFEAT